jgi:hypothetical protein
MVSLIVLCERMDGGRLTESGAAEAVVRTLSAFVGASIRGLVRDAVLVGPPQVNLRPIADHAGCAFVEAKTEAEGMQAALPLTRAPHLLIVHAGYVPETGFAEAIEDLLRFSKAGDRGWLLRSAPEKPHEKILPRLAPPAGLLAPRALCLGVKIPTFANLVAAVRPKSATRLNLRRIA